MKKNFRNIAMLPVAAVAALMLSGCSTVAPRVATDRADASLQIQQQRQEFKASIVQAEQARLDAQVVNKPYLVGNSQPLSREVSMPEVLRRKAPVTVLIQSGPVELQTALQQLAQASGIHINVTSDALLPPSAFAPRLGGAQSANPVQAPARVTMNVQDRPLWSVLDDVARQASVSWRPVNGGVEFYRVETRVFSLSAIPQMASTTASLGRNGGSNNVFESQSKTSFETKDQNLIKGLTASIDALLSMSGKATISAENQTLIVTDDRESLERVAAFVKEQNKAMSRRVRVLIEAIEVVDKDATEMGVDWNLLYATANSAISMSSPAALTGSQSGVLGLTAPEGSGRFAGSSVMLKALNSVGTVVNRRSFPFLTTSGRPVTQALRSTFNYVDQVQAATVASSATTAVAPTVTQKDETVGTFITVVPTAKPDGTIFLSVSFDVTSAQPLVPFTVGSSGSSVTVQQKTIDGTGIIQELPMRSGQTVVIGGIETQTAQSNARRMGEGAPMLIGGSDAHSFTKSRMILLVTAVTEEGV